MASHGGRARAIGLLITATALPLLSVTAPAHAASSVCGTIAIGRVHGLVSRPAHVMLTLASSYGSTNVSITECSKTSIGTYSQSWQSSGRTGYRGFAPAGAKREGDGKTPTGVFTLGTAFGKGNPGSSNGYITLRPSSCWGSTVGAASYNRYFTGACGPADESMYKYINTAYQQGLLINYNTQPIRQGYGSAIFFHVSTGGTTAGCISTDYNAVVKTIRATRPGDVIVEGVASAVIAGTAGVPNFANGSFVRAVDNGRVYRIAGGAPLWLSSCVQGCVGLTDTTQSVINRMPAVPTNGTFLRAAETGRVYRVAGGAPLWLSSCVAGCAGLVNVNQWTVNTLDHLRAYPADGTLLRAAENGRVYRAAGGAPLWLSSCVAGCAGLVNVNQWTVNTLDHLRAYPADGTLLRAIETGRVYQVAKGSPTWLSHCPAQGCIAMVIVDQWTIDTRDHLRP
jgi:L,D-peptidoglycan transpeptidase YkuD (ErfK/YbiS/YcfS/YnhG family)